MYQAHQYQQFGHQLRFILKSEKGFQITIILKIFRTHGCIVYELCISGKKKGMLKRERKKRDFVLIQIVETFRNYVFSSCIIT